ncbi:MAG: hypothetical protein AAF488_07190 [Planctomycetota bacterium]
MDFVAHLSAARVAFELSAIAPGALATPPQPNAWWLGDAWVTTEFLWVAGFCSLSGLILCLLFVQSERLREQRGARLAGSLGVVSGVGLYLFALSVLPAGQLETIAVSSVSLGALFGYAGVGSYLAFRASLDALQTVITRLPVDDSTRGSRLLRPSIAGYQRLLAERQRELAFHPTDVRLRKELFEIHLELGDVEGALFHGYALVELLPHGPSHGLALYRLCQTLVDRANGLEIAQPHLRRIIRLYPRSFFASYARRLVSQYEAYADREL